MIKRMIFTLTAALLTLPTYSKDAGMAAISCIQPDMVKQVSYARTELQSGDWAMAMAHANLVDFDRPLKVSVSFENVRPDLQNTCRKSLTAGMKIWQDALGGRPYEFTDQPGDADVEVTFKREVSEGKAPVGGLVRWRRSVEVVNDGPEQRTDAEAFIRTENPRGGHMTFEQMRHECAHELGHVLGLEDSPRSGEIMSMLDLQHPVSKAAKVEVEALMKVRKLAMQVKQDAVALAVSRV